MELIILVLQLVTILGFIYVVPCWAFYLLGQRNGKLEGQHQLALPPGADSVLIIKHIVRSTTRDEQKVIQTLQQYAKTMDELEQELGWSEDRLDAVLKELIEIHNVVKYEESTKTFSVIEELRSSKS